MPKADLEFLCEVDRLGAEGLTQAQIAQRLGVTDSTVAYRVLKSRLFGVSRWLRVVDHEGTPVSDLVASGELVPAEGPEGASA